LSGGQKENKTQQQLEGMLNSQVLRRKKKAVGTVKRKRLSVFSFATAAAAAAGDILPSSFVLMWGALRLIWARGMM
jgi:hypothetical protein